ncbi:MAG: peptide-methionine (S)-S-oxide reductase MsrA [Paracoccaceae bacterium]
MYHFIFKNQIDFSEDSKLEKAMFGMGCFWGAEKKFWELEGVKLTAVGYAGGVSRSPNYRDVCTGLTGHNEVVKLQFDPTEISYDQLLALFWENHDPTQLNRQGNDFGTQYRSGAYYFSQAQMLAIFETKEKYENSLRAAGFGSIVTEIKEAPECFLAEDYHQQYLAKNPQGYCGLGGTGISLRKKLETPIEAL